jgi:hypothetical protein
LVFSIRLHNDHIYSSPPKYEILARRAAAFRSLDSTWNSTSGPMTERRSKRLKAQSRIADTGEVSGSDSDEWSAGEVQPPKRISTNPQKRKLNNGSSSKSVAEAFRKVRGKRGALKHLTEAPLDVLFEVSDEIELLDVFSSPY